MPPLESSLEAFLHKRVRLLGGHTIKIAPTERGVPDRLVILPPGRLFLVELKTTAGRVSAIQQLWHERAATLGVQVQVLAGHDAIVSWLRDLTCENDPPPYGVPPLRRNR